MYKGKVEQREMFTVKQVLVLLIAACIVLTCAAPAARAEDAPLGPGAYVVMKLSKNHPEEATGEEHASAFEAYKKRHAGYIRSKLVIQGAFLSDKSLLDLPMFAKERDERSAVTKLRNSIVVDFSDAESMRIRVRAPDSNQAARLANAVKRSYFETVVATEKELRAEELAKFKEIAERRRERLKPLQARLDDLKKDSIDEKIKMAEERGSEIRKKASGLSLEVHRLRLQIDLAKKRSAEPADEIPTAKAVEKLEEQHKALQGELDLLVEQFGQEVAGLKKLKERRDEVEVLEPRVAYYRSAVNTLDEEIAKRRDAMRCTPTVEAGRDAPLTAE